MSTMRALATGLAAIVLGSCSAMGQATTSDVVPPTTKAPPPAAQKTAPDDEAHPITDVAPATPDAAPENIEELAKEKWSFSLSVFTYIVPDERDYAQPTFTADHGWLHLEARYNYEALDTASIWFGYNFSGGETLEWEFTPMLGGVFGDTTGIAPGYKGSLTWKMLELYSEGEYVFDTGNSADSFFYSWSELTLAPVDWLRFGLVMQRTRVHDADRDIQPGALVGFSYEGATLTGYILNPDEDNPTFVIAVGFSF
jgi:hypothetical protein